MARLSICRKFTFEAAHRLPNHEGKCKHVHGHGYKLFVKVTGPPFSKQTASEYGMLIDFSRFKKLVQDSVIDHLDHKMLNDVDGVPVPTAEMLVGWIADKLNGALEDTYVKLEQLKLYETEDCYAEWKAE